MKTAMKAFGVRLPNETKSYYEQEAAAMGVSIGDRIRRILKQHMDAEKKASADS